MDREAFRLDFERISAVEANGADVLPLSWRSERILVRAGNIVIKVHAADANASELRDRLNIISSAPWKEIFLAPIKTKLQSVAKGRQATLWPMGTPVDPEADTLPWVEAARLLARLHSIPVHGLGPEVPLVPCRALARVQEGLARLSQMDKKGANEDRELIQKAAKTLAFSPELLSSPHWVHGDWHLGQMVEIEEAGFSVWRLIDIEDMGVGHGIWDLARPAAFFAAGLLHKEDWDLFLSSYQLAGGPALPAGIDPWAVLEQPARALVIQSAASAVVKAYRENRALYEDEQFLVETCRRIVGQN